MPELQLSLLGAFIFMVNLLRLVRPLVAVGEMLLLQLVPPLRLVLVQQVQHLHLLQASQGPSRLQHLSAALHLSNPTALLETPVTVAPAKICNEPPVLKSYSQMILTKKNRRYLRHLNQSRRISLSSRFGSNRLAFLAVQLPTLIT